MTYLHLQPSGSGRAGDLAALAVATAEFDAPALCSWMASRAARAVGASGGTVFGVEGGTATRIVSFGSIAPAGEQAESILAAKAVATGGLTGANDRWLAVPLVAFRRVLGAVLFRRPDSAEPFGVADIDAAATSVGPLALAVDYARQQSEIERERAEYAIYQRQLEAYALDLRQTFDTARQRADQVAGALAELETTYTATVRGLAVAAEAKDEVTGGHLVRVQRYAAAVAALVAPGLSDGHDFVFGCMLHDIGKLAVPDAILRKPGPLDDAEWAVMRSHPAAGARILDGIPFLAGAREIVAMHHERWDGTGYPNGLRGEEIPLPSRIFPLADAFDAMTADRPYRPAMTIDQAREQIAGGRGTQFWAPAVDAFLSLPAETLREAQDAPV